MHKILYRFEKMSSVTSNDIVIRSEFYGDCISKLAAAGCFEPDEEKVAFLRAAGGLAAKAVRGARKARGVVGEGLTAAPGKARTRFGRGYRESMGRARETQIRAGTQGSAPISRKQSRRLAAGQEMARRSAPKQPVQLATKADPRAQKQLKQRLLQKRRVAPGVQQASKPSTLHKLIGGTAIAGAVGAPAYAAMSGQPAQQGY
jgi:hypothetical protein